MMNKKGYSTGFVWVFGLVNIFGLGIMYIVFNQVFTAHLVPVIKNMANNTAITGIDAATVTIIHTNIDKYMVFFNTLPFILFFMVILYMIVSAVRKERESEFG